MFKWLHNCTHFTWWQSNAQNPSSLKSRLQQYVKQELADVQAVFRKGRGTKDKIVNIHCIIEKAREFQKNIYFCFIDYTKAFDFVDYNKLWKILQEMGIPDHPTYLLRNLYTDKEATVRTGYRTTAAAAAAKSLQSCPAICDPTDGSPPGSSFHGILQARILEWIDISPGNLDSSLCFFQSGICTLLDVLCI